MSWWCPYCRAQVPDNQITFEEYHEICGTYVGDCQELGVELINEYIGIYNKPFVQIYINKIQANSLEEAENKFIKHLEEEYKEKYVEDVYIELISNIERI